MPWKLANPERLFDQTWRPRHPLRPRLSAARRWGMLLLLCGLSAVVVGYGFVTDARRVRAMAGAYLSDLLGADVHIGRASLSIFEGLRLDDVTVRAEGGYQPDAMIFHAQTLLVRYNPGELLAGKLAATQIVAIGPTVMLVEDPATGRWNYQRLWHGTGVPPRHNVASTGPTLLPEILLRDAQVAYLQLHGDRTQTVGQYSLEGRLWPGQEPDQYDFELQSRGRESLGPSVDGTLNTGGGPSVARLRNFTFGPDIKTMLPAEPRAWCQRHELQGRVDVPEMIFNPGRPGQTPSFRVEIALSSVELAVSPQEWMSRQQNQNLLWFHEMLDGAAAGQWMPADSIPTLRRLSTPEPVHLRQVSGSLVFTQKGIGLKGINGRLENNWFNVDGQIAGYSPDAAARITASSLEGHDLDIPAWSPTYAGSLPPEVQEIYERLHPQGTCGVSVTVDRKQAGGRLNVTGQIDIRDGQFRFSDFPYLLSGSTGTILIGRDPITKMNGIRIVNVHGHGLGGGPNEYATIALDGFIGPLDQVAGVWIDVRGKGLSSEPAIRAALPPPVDRALRLFDPVGNGELPKFHGDITCHIQRPIGPHKRWTFDTDVTLDRADGTLVYFPYPLRNLSGRLEVRERQLNIVGARMTRGDATLAIDGKVTWKNSASPPSTRRAGPDLQIVARNLPLDDDLKSALPAQQRDWLQKLGAQGKLDIDGRVFPAQPGAAPSDAEVDYAFDGKLRDGSLWPVDGTFALSNMTGRLRVTNGQFTLDDVTARRGSGTVTGRVGISWGGAAPHISVSGSAQQLPMDATLYKLLPPDARQSWDDVQPQGTVDATASFESGIGDPSAASSPSPRWDLQIRPRDLAVTPAVFPYRIEHLSGLLDISPQKVTLSDVNGRHGPTAVRLSGNANLGAQPQWMLKLSASPVAVDDDLVRAAPQIVSEVIKSLKLQGQFAIEFTRLAYRPVPAAQRTASATTQKSPAADLDFAATITLSGAAMDVGLPATDIAGTIDLAGLVRDGKLQRLGARLSAQKLQLAGRPATNFSAELAKASDEPVVQISRVGGQFAGGDLGGDGQFSYGDTGPVRYDFGLVLRDADVQQLTPASDKPINGRLTASVRLGGVLDDPSSRRGHGDVHVVGQSMYNLPVLLGLLQITNLTLPVSSPFSEANTRYSIDGQTVTFEQITLKSKDTSMSGSGTLDFAAKKVSLWFVTDDPNLMQLPVVGPLIHGAKQELLRIHVSGTIQQPKVSAASFNTVTTTVDQVLREGGQK